MYGFVTNELVKNNQEAHQRSYSWFTWSKSVDQPLKIIGFIKGAEQCFSFQTHLFVFLRKFQRCLFLQSHVLVRLSDKFCYVEC